MIDYSLQSLFAIVNTLYIIIIIIIIIILNPRQTMNHHN